MCACVRVFSCVPAPRYAKHAVGTLTTLFLVMDLALAPMAGVDEVDAAVSGAAAGADGGLLGYTFPSSIGSVMMLPTPLYHQTAAQESAQG